MRSGTRERGWSVGDGPTAWLLNSLRHRQREASREAIRARRRKLPPEYQAARVRIAGLLDRIEAMWREEVRQMEQESEARDE
jgi:hypothetical protein